MKITLAEDGIGDERMLVAVECVGDEFNKMANPKLNRVGVECRDNLVVLESGGEEMKMNKNKQASMNPIQGCDKEQPWKMTRTGAMWLNWISGNNLI